MSDDVGDKKKYNRALLTHIKPRYKVWLSIASKPVMGAGRYKILKTISKTHSIKETARLLNISYRSCQNYIKKMEERLDTEIVCTERGGINGGGSAHLTAFGRSLIKKYESIKVKVELNAKG